MARKVFTQEQLQSLNANPYTLNATPIRFMLTKEAKEKILAMAEDGMSIAHIIRELGYDPDVLGRHRIKGLVGRIRMEAESPQGVRGGYARRTTKRLTAGQIAELEENPESYAKLKREVVYLREEVEFLKKVSQQAISGKRGK